MQKLLADFGRFTVGISPDPLPVDFRHLVKATAGALKASVNVPIEVTITGQPLPIYGDRRLLPVVISELVENAEEAMQLANSPSRIIRIHARLEHPPGGPAVALLEIADTGPGITAEHSKNIFQPLFTTKERGSGLGLMAVWDIVEQHKGTIAEVGAPGAGARFLVRLPLVGY